jgi:hypothetical protein
MVPLELTNEYLSAFFKKGWPVVYKVAIELLRHYEDKLLSLKDAGAVIG